MSKPNIGKEEFIRVGTTLYKLVNQPRLNGGYVKKRIVWTTRHYGRTMASTFSPLSPSMTVSALCPTM